MLQQIVRAAAGRSVLCAVSGGVDSVVLLHLLKSSGVKLAAAHMEHGIRGESSRRDCAFVQSLCAAWEIPLVVEHADVPAEAKRTGCGLEETARRLRYAFLYRQKDALGLDVIAVAHHLNDQAETLLMHLIRGAAPSGLSGMRGERDGLIRPLLPFSREQIEDYAVKNGLSWVCDETNEDTAYTRNRIRAQIIPQLEAINPQAVAALGRLAQLSAAQNDFVAQEAEKILAQRMSGKALGDVRDVHPGLRQAVLHRYLVLCGAKDVSCEDVERLSGLFVLQCGKRVSIGRALFERDVSGVRRVEEAQIGAWPLHMGENDTPLGRITLCPGPIPQDLDLGKKAQVLDADKAGKDLFVRTRQSGDRVQLLGSRGSRLLSDVLTDRKIPRSQRDHVPLIVRENEIIWIAGIAPCAGCAVDADSRRALILYYEENQAE